jgi:CheY-like chemotaxis protein
MRFARVAVRPAEYNPKVSSISEHTLNHSSIRELLLSQGTAMDKRVVKIAIAEDEPDLRGILKSLLERLGHQVVCTAANGAELLSSCFNQHVDVVLMDFDMPVMDGLEAAEVVAAKGIPVILISGHPEATQVVVENEPVVGRLLKPPSLESLQLAIERACVKSR